MTLDDATQVWIGDGGYASARTHIVNSWGYRACGTQGHHGHRKALGTWADVDCQSCRRRVGRMEPDHFARKYDPAHEGPRR